MIREKAYAKINLGLDVLRRRPDGYHEVKMIMQTVDICDDLTFEKREEPGIGFQIEGADLPADENNLVYRAAALLTEKRQIKKGVSITLQKRIPVAAGMAGGSADAAAALVGLALEIGPKDAMAVAAGFGWYSLAPSLLAPYSLPVSAVCFLANVMREVFAILAIPLVARRIGFVESVALPGAAAMDTVLPVVIGSTHERITIYSFTSGVILSLAVPLLVSAIIAL